MIMAINFKRFIEAQRKDYSFRTVISSAFSMLINFSFTLYNGALGIVYQSIWNGSICVYFFLLAGVRAIIVHSQRSEATHQYRRGITHQRKVYSVTHMLLIMMNISLVVPAIVMVEGGRSYTYGLIPAIAMAAYTTYRITISIVHYMRSRNNENILVMELRTINLIDSLVAILTLQNTLISANGGMNARMQTLSSWTSAGILTIILAITLQSFLQMKKG